jgi:hypothetical protein
MTDTSQPRVPAGTATAGEYAPKVGSAPTTTLTPRRDFREILSDAAYNAEYTVKYPPPPRSASQIVTFWRPSARSENDRDELSAHVVQINYKLGLRKNHIIDFYTKRTGKTADDFPGLRDSKRRENLSAAAEEYFASMPKALPGGSEGWDVAVAERMYVQAVTLDRAHGINHGGPGSALYEVGQMWQTGHGGLTPHEAVNKYELFDIWT